MPDCINFVRKLKRKKVILALIISLLFSFSSVAIAGYPIGGANGIYFYNVKSGKFSVAWEVDESSTACSVKLYYDINGTRPLSQLKYSVFSGTTTNQTAGLSLGVMQADVRDLDADPNTYYVQTVSEVGDQRYVYPDPNIGESLIPVLTEPPCVQAFPPDNGYLFLKVYNDSGLDEGNQICQGVVLFISAQQGADHSNYPISISSADDSGFPGAGCSYDQINMGDFRKGTNTSDNYYRWSSSNDYNLTITCLGGQVEGVGYGRRTVNTAFLGSWITILIPDSCLANVDGCDSSTGLYYSQIQIFRNRPPQIVLEQTSYTDPFDAGVPAYYANRNQEMNIQVCAYDPEEDPIVFSLDGTVPNAMDLADIDANCKSIHWTPPAGAECFNHNILVTVSDGSNSADQKFAVIVQHCPPSQPTVSITPPEPYSYQDITCTASPGSVVNPDPDETTYLDFTWYKEGSGVVLSDNNKVFDSQDVDSYTSTLPSSNTSRGDQIYCSVVAHDNDGSAPERQSTTVIVRNSPPAVPAGATISPTPATTNTDLVCRVDKASTPDMDPEDTVYYEFAWYLNGSLQSVTDPPIDSNFTTLDHSNTAKNQSWECKVRAWDQTAFSTGSADSAPLVIANTPPNTPQGAVITPADPNTGDTLRCTVTPASPVDIDQADQSNITYEYTWRCNACSKNPEVHGPKAETYDTLGPQKTAKGERWYCEVRAKDTTDFSGSVTATEVEILNTPPTGLDVELRPQDAQQATPDVYIDKDLICSVIQVPNDPDADTILYTYVWEESTSSRTIGPEAPAANTSSTLSKSELKRGETWSCTVTATDGTADITDTSNAVDIVNRAPTISVNPPEDIQLLEEGETIDITVSGTDPDADTIMYYLDTNYTDPSDAGISGLLEVSYNTDNHTLTVTPLPGASTASVGGEQPGVYRFKFVVKDEMRTGEDPSLALSASKLITVQVVFPCVMIEDFESGVGNWYWLMGYGSFASKTDPNNNKYMQTSVNATPSNNSQLGYIITRRFTPEENNTNSKLQVKISDKNQYYVEAYVLGFKDSSEKNFFLRYIPADPKDSYSISGNSYVNYNIGTEYVNPNQIKVLERDMDEDLFKTTGWRYRYLKAVILRGDINYIDDFKLCRGKVNIKPPEEVLSLTAAGGNKKVNLSWELDPNQDEDIAGYKIYVSAADYPVADISTYLTSVSKTTTSYLVTKMPNGATLQNNVRYYFRVTAYDNAAETKESEGVLADTLTVVTPPQPPSDLTSKYENGNIILEWKNPLNQTPDLDGYVIYYCSCENDCSSCYNVFVSKNEADSGGKFTKTITRDAQGNPLSGDYPFTIKAKDTLSPAQYSSGAQVTENVPELPKLIIDDFEYTSGQTPAQNGWFRLQGVGSYAMLTEGTNHYLKVTSSYTACSSATAYIIMKLLQNPETFTNPDFSMRIKSAGCFRIDLYVKATNNKSYYLSYIGDPSKSTDSDPVVQSGWVEFKLGWSDKLNVWEVVNRDLAADLAHLGVNYAYIKGLLVRGTLNIDDFMLESPVSQVQYLTARPGNNSTLLSWKVANPDIIDQTKIYRNNTLMAGAVPTRIGTTNEYQYNVTTGLSNGTTYTFKVALVTEGEEGEGVTVTSTPRAFDLTETFDSVTGWLEGWSSGVTPVPNYGTIYDSDVQSDVFYMNVNHQYPDRYYMTKEYNIGSVTNIAFRIKSQINTNFIIWIEATDNQGLPFWIGFVPSGTKDTFVWHGWFGYYYLGSEYKDGKWHYVDKNLDNILSTNIGVGLNTINSISIGGNIRFDDLSLY